MGKSQENIGKPKGNVGNSPNEGVILLGKWGKSYVFKGGKGKSSIKVTSLKSSWDIWIHMGYDFGGATTFSGSIWIRSGMRNHAKPCETMRKHAKAVPKLGCQSDSDFFN